MSLLLMDGQGEGSAGEQVPSMRVRVLAMGVSVREEGVRHAGMTNPATPVVLGEAAGRPVLSWLLAT